jgi:hypothetical protein
VIKEIKEKGEKQWLQEWNDSTKGETTKSFFPNIGERKSKRLQMGIDLSTIVTGHRTTTDSKSMRIRHVCAERALRPQIT